MKNTRKGKFMLPYWLYANSLDKGGEGSGADKYFLVEVFGDGMRLAGIHEGDIAVFYKKSDASDGDIVAVKVDDGELECRRYLTYGGNKVRIRREDGKTPDMVIPKSRAEVAGVLVTLIRRYHAQVAEG